MPKPLFYIGVTSCVFLALAAVASLGRQLEGGAASLLAVHGRVVGGGAATAWAMIFALLVATGVAAILVRMAALLAARNLFGAFVALFSASAAVVSLSWVVLLQVRMLTLVHRRVEIGASLQEMHGASVLVLGYFIALSFLALRPYFRIQASRFLSALVFFPLPLFLLIVIQELFVSGAGTLMPSTTPASLVFLGSVAMLAFAIAVHCVRHRHMFIEMTNLRELLEPRIDPAQRHIGGVAFE